MLTRNEKYMGNIPYSERDNMELRFRVKIVGDSKSDAVKVKRPSVVEQEVEELTAEELV